MRHPLLPIAVLFGLHTSACGNDVVVADEVDSNWKDDVWADNGDAEAPTTTPGISDPQTIDGTISVYIDSVGCLLSFHMQGERTDCRDCDYAFWVDLDVADDGCGLGSSGVSGMFMLRNEHVYFEYFDWGPATLSGPLLEWDNSLEDSPTEPYYYGDYYYDYYRTSYHYYGSAILAD